MLDLTDIQTLKSLMAREGIAPKHSAGQNFLVCGEPVEAAVEILKEGPPNVTELGAGMGPLTLPLLEARFQVRAIEKDSSLASILRKTAPPALREKLELIVGDLRYTQWEQEQPYQIAGNIPYNLSGLIFRKITQLAPAPTAVVLMVQREVALRLTAEPPNMNLLALAVQLWGKAHVVLNVPRNCFWPQPEVESSLVLLTPRKPQFPLLRQGSAGQAMTNDQYDEREELLDFVKPFFQAKRKQMGGVLRRAYNLSEDEATEKLKQAGIETSARPQEVSLEQWKTLYFFLGHH